MAKFTKVFRDDPPRVIWFPDHSGGNTPSDSDIVIATADSCRQLKAGGTPVETEEARAAWEKLSAFTASLQQSRINEAAERGEDFDGDPTDYLE